MPERHDHDVKVKIIGRLTQFIQRYRIVFVLIGAAVILFPIVFYIISSANQKIFEESTQKSYLVDKKYEEYKQTTDPDKKPQVEKELFVLIEETVNQYGNRYAGAHALFIRATINNEKAALAGDAESNELLIDSIRDFTRIDDISGGTFMAPLSLMQAATIIVNIPARMTQDKSGKLKLTVEAIVKVIPEKLLGADAAKLASFEEVALRLYEYIVDHYPKSIYIAEALINMGTQYEAGKQYKEAGQVYLRLESEYASNDWTKIAINRKIALEAEGHLTD